MDPNGPRRLDVPQESLRVGFGSDTDFNAVQHPVQTLQKEAAKFDTQTRLATLERVYGSALVMERQLERQMLSKIRRPPGLPSSLLSLHSMSGELDELTWADVRVGALESEYAASDMGMHYQMEKRLGLTPRPPALRHS